MSDTHKDGTVLTYSHNDVALKRDGGWIGLDDAPSLLAWQQNGYPALTPDRPEFAGLHRIGWDEIAGADVRLADPALTRAAHEFAKYVL